MLQRRVSMSATWDAAAAGMSVSGKRCVDTLNHFVERSAAQIVRWNSIGQRADTSNCVTDAAPRYEIRIRKERQQRMGGLQPHKLAWTGQAFAALQENQRSRVRRGGCFFRMN